MDNLKELKLMIYESSLDVCDKEDLLTIVESTDDEEILSEVFDILEDSRADSIKTFSSVKQKDIKTTGREIKEKISDAKRIINNKEDDISKINRDIKDTIKYWKDQNDPFEYLNNKYDLDGKSYNSKLKSQREEITSQIKKLRSEINKHEQDRVNLKTKSVILNDMKTKYKNNPDKMKQVRDIREKHGHKLESVLEAFKEGILTESEIKLMIYESSLDESDKEDLLNIIESTDDEEVLSEVIDVLEATRLSKEIHKVATGQKAASIRDRALATEVDTLGVGRKISKMTQEEMNKCFEDDELKNELIEKDSKHNIKHVIGTSPKPRQKKIMQHRRYNTLNTYPRDGLKQLIKDKYKNYNGTDFTNRKGPFNFYRIDLKNSEMKDRIIRNAIERNNPKEIEKMRKIGRKYGHKLESVLEAFNEGILTESEVLELFEASKDEIDYIATQGSFERMNKNTNAMMKNVDKIISGEYKEKKLSEAEKRKRDLKEGYKTLHNDEMYKKLFKDK